MRVKGKYRAQENSNPGFLRNKFEGLSIEPTGEEWDENEDEEKKLVKEKSKGKYKSKKNKERRKLETIIEEEPKLKEKKEASSETTVTEEVEEGSDKESIKSTSSDNYTSSAKSESNENENTQSCETPEEIVINAAKFTELQPSKLLTVKLKVEGHGVLGILDTGSDNSLISKSIVQFCRIPVDNQKTRSFKGLGQEEQKTLGQAKIPFSMFGVDMGETSFDVVDDFVIPEGAILGRQFLAKKHIIIDSANNRISIPITKTSKMDIYQDQNEIIKRVIYESIPVCATKDMSIRDTLTKVPIKYDYYSNYVRCESKTKVFYEGKCNNKRIKGIDGTMDLKGEKKFVVLVAMDGEDESK